MHTPTISLKALRLAAVVMAHGHPRCMACSTDTDTLEATCWCWYRTGVVSEMETTHFFATNSSVRNWLGY